MRLRAVAAIAALALAGACSMQAPPPDDLPRVEQVQPASFNAPHGLQFKVVDDGATVMKALFEAVAADRQQRSNDPAAIARGVTAEIDRWRVDDQGLTDFYLTANAPGVIEAYIADAAAADPDLAIPRDRQLAFEQVAPDRWRSYLLLPAAELDATAIAKATAFTDPGSDRPGLLVDFTPAAARTFSDLTARIAGHKLAVLLDGSVISAPVIQGPITGGQASITFGAEQHDAAAVAQAILAEAAR
jgi:SecD-like export protein